jgi:hypothetical protein
MSRMNDVNDRKYTEPEVLPSESVRENDEKRIIGHGMGKCGHVMKNEDAEELNGKRPSDHLISLIKNFGKSYADLKKLASKIKEIGEEEGFSCLELTLLARQILQRRKNFSSRQLNYWFPLKGNWDGSAKEESTSEKTQRENNDDKKDTEKSLAPAPSVPVTNGFQKEDEDLQFGSDFHPASSATFTEMPNKRGHTISFSDLTSPEKIDCTNHPMYRRASEIIVKLRQDLFRKENSEG